MARLLYSGTVSVDGYLAGPHGDMSWAARHFGPNPEIDELVKQIGALLVGHRTFTGDDPYRGVRDKEGKPFGGGWSGPQFVVTHQPPAGEIPGVTFYSDLEPAIVASKAAAGDGYVNVLGADVARQCIELGELDEVLLLIAPVMLGDGVRILHRPGGLNVDLDLISVTTLPHVTNMWFRVRRT